MFRHFSSPKFLGVIILVLGISISLQTVFYTVFAPDVFSDVDIDPPINVRVDNIVGNPILAVTEFWKIYNKTNDNNSFNIWASSGANRLTIQQDGTMKVGKQVNAPKYCDENGVNCKLTTEMGVSTVASGQLVVRDSAEAMSGYTYIGTVVTSLVGQENWTAKEPMPTARRSLAVASVNGKIYALGGMDNAGRTTAKNEEYDLATNTWVAKAEMPTARQGLTAAVVSGKIYAIGGSTNKNEEYDPLANTWATKAIVPTHRYGAQAAVVNNKIYLIGGSASSSGLPSNVNEEYTPASDLWATRTSMPTAREYFGVASVNGKIYAIGGYNSGASAKNEEYNPTTNAWATKANMTTARRYIAVASANGKVYAIGGGETRDGLNKNEEYNPATNTWATKASLPTPRYRVSAATLNEKIYVIGGTDASGNTLANMESYSILGNQHLFRKD